MTRAEQAGRVDLRGDVAEVFSRAEEVGVLDHHSRDTAVERGGDRRPVGRFPDGRRQFGEPQAEVAGVAADHQAVDRVDAAGHDDCVAPGGVHGGEDRLGQRRAAVVHRGVGGIEAGEAADHRLELEDRLQGALRHLGLVGSVGREELAARDEAVDRRRDGVVVEAGAEEARQVMGVAVRERMQVVVDLLLGEAVGHLQPL